MNHIKSFAESHPALFVGYYRSGGERKSFTLPSQELLDLWGAECAKIRRKYPNNPDPLYEDVYAFKQKHKIA